MGICCTAGQATDDNMAQTHCVLDKEGYKHKLIICNTFRFSNATTVLRKRQNVTLHVYVHWLACLLDSNHNVFIFIAIVF
jgi:hypothetical protein